jgi:hypothetical protein
MKMNEPREIDLERELDSLYRKVAGLDQPEGDGQMPVKARSEPKKGRRFWSVGAALGLAVALFLLGILVVLGEWRRSPADPGVIELTAEEKGEAKGKGREALPAVDPSAGGQGDRYAIQIRAYPEDQKQNALAFLEDMRKKTPAVSMETVAVAGRGLWHRILLGNFSTAEEAADYQKSDGVAREHPYPFIQRRYGGGSPPSPVP